MIFICIYGGIILLTVVVKLAAALRLSIPLLYALLVPILFREWYYANEVLGNGIFFALLGAVALSWVITIVRTVRNLS